MLGEMEVLQAGVQPLAAIALVVPRAEMPKVMGPAVTEILSALSAQGVQPTGALTAHHLRLDPRVFDFHVGFPVAAAIRAEGRVFAAELPAARVARVVYQGPYEGLGAAWAEFEGLIAAAGSAPQEELWESYLVGPESGMGSAEFQTQLNRPLRT